MSDDKARELAEEDATARLELGVESLEPPHFIADSVPKPLDENFIASETVASWITTAVVGGLSLTVLVPVCFAGDMGGGPVSLLLGVWLLLVAVLIWLSRSYPRWVYHHTRYVITPFGIEIRRGILWKSVISVPRSRVQHTDITQGPLMRQYGIAKLVIHTAGTENASVELSGLARDDAFRIREFLTPGGSADGV